MGHKRHVQFQKTKDDNKKGLASRMQARTLISEPVSQPGGFAPDPIRKTPRVVTYSRVSTRHHDQKPEIQVNELRRYCHARDWKITHEIVDHHTGGSADRPGLKKLLDLVRTREVDAVIVLKLDRLFRSLKHLLTQLEEFDDLGIKFVAVKDAVDWTTPSGRLFLQVLGSLAEFERGLLRERTMMGLDHARASGKILGRPKIHDDDAIRKLRRKGLSYVAIQKRLSISKGAVWRALSENQKK